LQRHSVTAYWDVYDRQTGQLLEAERLVKDRTWPAIGEFVVGIPGKPNAIVRDVNLKGMKGSLPHYEVYV
jgi:hypothetical protein